jgi:predicted NAD-dependent protein-ADP-ribosyltransferase YbiA (DUF1768 family)
MQQANPMLTTWANKPERRRFPTVEHAWTALRAQNEASYIMFIVGSPLAEVSYKVLELIYAHDKAERKAEQWSASNHVGHMAKLAGNPHFQNVLGLAMTNARVDCVLERAIWLQLLRLKFEQNPDHLEMLQRTHSARLIELDRGAEKHGSHWGGLVRGDVLHGENVMGNYLEEVRAMLQ